MRDYLREIPAVHELQKDGRFAGLMADYQLSSIQATKFIQQEIQALRERLLYGKLPFEPENPDFTELIFSHAQKKAEKWNEDRLMRVINGTGTVLHTNLGRAKLSQRAVEHVARAASHYTNLEYRIDEGKRGSRHELIEELLKEATGAEAAMIVNNNAAAVFLVLTALAKNREVIVSRGQLVEIGGSFRISSIMEESGARLVEVGTTNKTHVSDYANALNEETAMIMKVHTSNFKMIGFTDSVATEDLVQLKNQGEGVVFYEDLGSGALYDFKKHGIGDEPLVKEVIETGVDLVSFSGDKLLGGPQAGIIAGKKELIDRLKKHQLARVLRVDKMTFAALEETLKAYISGEAVAKELPTVRDITKSIDEIQKQTQDFLAAMSVKAQRFHIEIKESVSQIGGGTMPGVELPTCIAAISHNRFSARQLAEKLRTFHPPVISRIEDDKVCLDFRTINPAEMPEIVNGFQKLQQAKQD